MTRFAILCLTLAVGLCTSPLVAQTRNENSVNDQIPVAASDWPWWRGPRRNGIASADPLPPVSWSATENVVWKAPVPGRGHGSPTIVGKHVYLATADEKNNTQSVVCYDRATGKQLWETEVHKGGLMRQHDKSSAASSTVACDGERLYINFANSGAIHATALDLAGKQLWQTKVSDYVIHQGYGSSPALYQSLLIVGADGKGGGAVAGLDRKFGKIVWKHDRPKFPNYASPIILHANMQDQLILIGCDLVSSFDPLTGKVLWEIAGATTECVTSTPTDGKHIFTSGGYPRNHLAAVLADGSGTIAWETKDRVYVPSLLVREGNLYGVLDAGVAACWNCESGDEVWKQRLGGTFTASPVLAGDRLYATNEAGETFVYLATPEKYTSLGTNKLGDEAYASQAICGGRIYARVVQQVDGRRQEMLYCVGEAKGK